MPTAAVLGVDLAWGPRARTGLALLDAAGRLIASATVRDDDEIAAFVAPHAAGLTVVALDAPLVVRNAVGRRRCEAEVAADFARFHAGPYPTNLGMAHLSPRPRGAVLAERLGWVLDPGAAAVAGTPVGLEVYPHPATVSLFGLPRVLPYKGRAGRAFDVRHAAATELVGLIDARLGADLGLSGSPRWAQLRAAVATATRPADLDRVEDEIDAVLCAYIGLRWWRRPADLRVYGDAAEGYLVTFPPPLTPAAAPPGPPR